MGCTMNSAAERGTVDTTAHAPALFASYPCSLRKSWQGQIVNGGPPGT